MNNPLYQLRIEPENKPEVVLDFPSGIADIVNNHFRQQYPTGQDLLQHLEENKKSMPDAIAERYLSKQRKISYSLSGNMLTFQICYTQGINGPGLDVTTDEIMFMLAMNFLAYNHALMKSAINPEDGPINIVYGKMEQQASTSRPVTQEELSFLFGKLQEKKENGPEWLINWNFVGANLN